MKNVRIFFTKTGRLKFISHLDMNRFMIRVFKKTNIPIWYTEGFNPHPYITFALPLSLGQESVYEILDIRLTDDDFPLDELCLRLQGACPEGIEILRAAEPQEKTADIGFCEYKITFDTKDNEFLSALKQFLEQDSIPCKKLTKRKKINEFDLKEKIEKFSFDGSSLTVVLPAGSATNINPTLLTDTFYERAGDSYVCYSILRIKVFDKNMKPFV